MRHLPVEEFLMKEDISDRQNRSRSGVRITAGSDSTEYRAQPAQLLIQPISLLIRVGRQGTCQTVVALRKLEIGLREKLLACQIAKAREARLWNHIVWERVSGEGIPDC